MSQEARKQLSLWIEVTEACQYKCRFCYNGWRSSPPRFHRAMPLEVVPRIADLAQRLSDDFAVSLILAGGDASAHPRFLDIVTMLSSCAPIDIVTHGAEIDAAMLDRFSALQNVALQLSVPSPDEHRYRFLTGGGRLDRVVETALYASAAAVPLSLSAVLTNVNLEDAAPIVHFAAELNADYVVLNRFLPSGRGAHYENRFGIAQEAFARAVDDASTVGKARNVRVYASGALPGVRRRKMESLKMTVSVDGGIRICSLADAALGTIDEAGDALLAKYYSFWRSDQRLAGCFCSTL